MIGGALPADVNKIKELIDYWVQKDEMLPRPVSELYASLRDFFVYRKDEKILGCAALRLYWDDLAEIKSLAVDKDCVGTGIGSELVTACLDAAQQFKIKKVFTLSTKPDFFLKMGFKRVSKDDLPQKVWGDCIKCSKYEKCDENAFVYEIQI